MLMEYEDCIFQAHANLDNLWDQFQDDATLQSCADDVVTMRLRDGSEMTVNLAPIQRFLDAMRQLPPVPDR